MMNQNICSDTSDAAKPVWEADTPHNQKAKVSCSFVLRLYTIINEAAQMFSWHKSSRLFWIDRDFVDWVTSWVVNM